jgi:hypothetical protein
MNYYEKQIANAKNRSGLTDLGEHDGCKYYFYFDPVKAVVGFKKNFNLQDNHVKGITYIPARLLPEVKRAVDRLMEEEETE